MEIEFNTNYVGKADPVKPLERPNHVRSADADASFQTQALRKKLDELPMVRQDKVEYAKTLVAGAYPPDPILKSLANLLALKLIN